MKPLRNTTIIDLSKVFAGPFCTQQLSDLGAKVIKVEAINTGDDTRSWAPQKDGHASPFLAFNRNKRSIALDLKTEEGRRIVHELVKQGDVVIQSFKVSTAKKLQVDYESLSGINDKLVYCEITGYGSGGPLSHLPGYDVMLQAFGGIISTLGEPDGPPTRVSFSPVDMGTGMFGASSILAALLERSQSGKGARIELSLLDTSLALMSYLAQNYWTTGQVPARTGWVHTAIAPYQAFRAADTDIMLGVGNEGQWQQMCRIFGREDWLEDPKLKTNTDRVQHCAYTAGLVQGEVEKKDASWCLEKMGEAGIPCAPINTVKEALEHPQTQARGQVVTTEHPALGELPMVGYPVVFNGEARSIESAPPLLGQHSWEILNDAGYTVGAITDFIERGIVQQHETQS